MAATVAVLAPRKAIAPELSIAIVRITMDSSYATSGGEVVDLTSAGFTYVKGITPISDVAGYGVSYLGGTYSSTGLGYPAATGKIKFWEGDNDGSDGPMQEIGADDISAVVFDALVFGD